MDKIRALVLEQVKQKHYDSFRAAKGAAVVTAPAIPSDWSHSNALDRLIEKELEQEKLAPMVHVAGIRVGLAGPTFWL